MNFKRTFLAAIALIVSGAAAQASSIYASSVVNYTRGFCTGNALGCDGYDPSRYIDAHALGAPDGNFVALGFGGSIELGFAGSPFPGGTASVYEITTNRFNGHDEAVEVFAVSGGIVGPSLGIISNTPDGKGSVQVGGSFDTILLVDVTKSVFASTTSFDGFDVDAVGISAVPLPAAGLMLLMGVGSIGLMRRRKKAA